MNVHSDSIQGGRPVTTERTRTSDGKGPKVARHGAAGDDEMPKMRITGQFRHAGVMVYDLKAGERRIELRIGLRSPEDSSATWGVALFLKGAGEPTTVHADGPTRLLALETLEQTSSDLLPKENWTEIREALTEVRAL
jgi:hypothetical protein